MANALLILLGLAAGVFSGLMGLGGGIILVPALVMWFGFSQHMAQGTTLAMMVPPIGLLAAWAYYKQGHVNLLAAVLLAVGFIAGSFWGAKLANSIGDEMMRKIFGGVLILIALKLIFTR